MFGVTKVHSNNCNWNWLVLCWACVVTLKRTLSIGISWRIYYCMSVELSLSFHLIYTWFLSCMTDINCWAVSWWVLIEYFSVFLHHQSPWRWRHFIPPKCLTHTCCILNGVRTQKTIIYIISVQDHIIAYWVSCTRGAFDTEQVNWSDDACDLCWGAAVLTGLLWFASFLWDITIWHHFGHSCFLPSIPFPNCLSLVLPLDTIKSKFNHNLSK